MGTQRRCHGGGRVNWWQAKIKQCQQIGDLGRDWLDRLENKSTLHENLSEWLQTQHHYLAGILVFLDSPFLPGWGLVSRRWPWAIILGITDNGAPKKTHYSSSPLFFLILYRACTPFRQCLPALGKWLIPLHLLNQQLCKDLEANFSTISLKVMAQHNYP